MAPRFHRSDSDPNVRIVGMDDEDEIAFTWPAGTPLMMSCAERVNGAVAWQATLNRTPVAERELPSEKAHCCAVIELPTERSGEVANPVDPSSAVGVPHVELEPAPHTFGPMLAVETL